MDRKLKEPNRFDWAESMGVGDQHTCYYNQKNKKNTVPTMKIRNPSR